MGYLRQAVQADGCRNAEASCGHRRRNRQDSGGLRVMGVSQESMDIKLIMLATGFDYEMARRHYVRGWRLRLIDTKSKNKTTAKVYYTSDITGLALQ